MNDFWSGGISNPLEVIEQLTVLLLVAGLDERHARAENQANATGAPIEDGVFPDGDFTPEDKAKSRPFDDLRWRRFKNLPAQEMFSASAR